MFTSSIILKIAHYFLLFGNEEKLVALLRSTSCFCGMVPCSLVVAVFFAQMRSDSGILPLQHSNSVSDVTRLVTTEHVRNAFSLRESIRLKSVVVLIASFWSFYLIKLHFLQLIKPSDFLEKKGGFIFNKINDVINIKIAPIS